uniref:Uncharacterized protein n=1 Tax=Steinernema hermaphroditum TaxID=289476 RepID=A0AA39LAN0_9BILA|nr:hypothetical protein QR680_019392 [Steinernema hermaphroditum]
MGGGGKSNDAAINEQRKAAAEARYKDDLRSWRMERGVNEINNLFDGTPLPSLRDKPTYNTNSTNYTPTTGVSSANMQNYYTSSIAKGFQGNILDAMTRFVRTGGRGDGYSETMAAPEGYKLVTQTVRTGGRGDSDEVQKYVWQGNRDGHTGQQGYYDLNKMLQAGVINKSVYDQYNKNGNGFLYDSDAEQTGQLNKYLQDNAGKNQYGITENNKNWVDDLAGTYLTAYNDYYMPQLQNQYSEANKNLTYDLARTGLLRSSAAADTQSDLARQNAENTAMVKSQGDQGVAALKSKINSAKQNAINQLYSTENPEVAANQALSSIRTIQSEQPSYSPLGDIFKTAVVGMGGYSSGAADRRYNNIITGGNRKASSTVG